MALKRAAHDSRDEDDILGFGPEVPGAWGAAFHELGECNGSHPCLNLDFGGWILQQSKLSFIVTNQKLLKASQIAFQHASLSQRQDLVVRSQVKIVLICQAVEQSANIFVLRP